MEHLAASLGLRGAVRGKAWKTTIPDMNADRPRDLVQRSFTAQAPNQLWVADITCVSTWRHSVVYVAFVIDVFARRIVGWRVLWKTIDDVEYATCEWIDWYNNRRLPQPIGDMPPAELEQANYERREGHAEAA